MEPIRLWRRNFLRGTQPMWVDEEPKHPAYFQDFVAVRCHEFDALAAEAADARTLRAERDSLVKERDDLKIEVKAADCAGRFMEGMRNAATARADKAEAALKDALARIDALLEKPNG